MKLLTMKWPVLAAISLLACLGLAGAADKTNAPRPNLTGRVEMSDGSAATATVLIDTAGPKTGTSTFCPSCYADCRKKTKTDANGDFKIESLDPELKFRILIVGDGCTPQFVKNVDPADGPVYVSLEKRDLSKVPPANMLHGRVLDTNGAPIEAATIETFGIHEKDGQTMWGQIEEVDPLAVTDAKGEFVLTSRKPFAALDVKVDGRGFAKKTFTDLAGGDVRHDLTLTEGATVTGHVLFDGKPLSNISVGIVSTDRRMENFTGDYEIGTDTNGQFAFVNLPPNVQYTLYGIMDSLKNFGSINARQVSAGGDGSTTDAGNITVIPGHHLAGKVILNDGGTIPAGTRLLAGLEGAWDTLQTTLQKDGHFSFSNLPSSEVSLSLRVSGYHLSGKNASLDRLNPQLKGRVDRDLTNVTILLEKGPEPERDYGNMDLEDSPANRPLAGVEGGGKPTAASWQISGHVLDAKTGQPVAKFQVTPGNKRYSQINLDTYNRVDGSNGVYTVSLNKRFADPILKVEAPGYLPAAVTPRLADKSDFDIKLEPGSGPSGTVLLPDGKPAAEISVGLVCSDRQGLGASADTLQSWRDKNLVQRTDKDGHFAFKPELEMEKVVALCAEGFRMVSLQDLATNSKITLDAWGKLKGTLHRPNGPGTNEDLDLAFSGDVMKNPWSFNPNCHAVTDDKGAFEFYRVPPTQLQLSYRVKMGMGGGGWQNVPLQRVTIAPGQTLELKVEAGEATKENASFATQVRRKLAKRVGPPVVGSVLLPDGNPAAGAQVALMVSNEYLGLGRLTLHAGQDTELKTTTDGAGHFTLPGVEGTMGIVAINDTGFARTDWGTGSNTPALRLEPWGEIHGTLHIGPKLGTNEDVALVASDFGSFNYDFQEYKTTTDDQGKFVFTFVPPGEQVVGRLIRMGQGSWTAGSQSPVNVKAGGTTEVSIGGTGWQVVGRVKYKDGAGDADFTDLMIGMHEPYNPEEWKSKARRPRSFYATTNGDGSFVFEDVLPGNYQLNIQTQQRRQMNGGIFMNMKPLASKEVTIPDGGKPGGKPFDIGTVNLRQPHDLKVGDLATDFALDTSDGKTAHLADYRGKYVLLHFFYQRMTSAEAIASLKNIYDTYGKDKRFAMLGVSYGTVSTLKTFASENGLKWTLGTILTPMENLEASDYSQTPVAPSYLIAYLIGPDGKMIAKGLRYDEIKPALERELKKEAAAAPGR
jgi:uncharacterized GH25 family protein